MVGGFFISAASLWAPFCSVAVTGSGGRLKQDSATTKSKTHRTPVSPNLPAAHCSATKTAPCLWENTYSRSSIVRTEASRRKPPTFTPAHPLAIIPTLSLTVVSFSMPQPDRPMLLNAVPENIRSRLADYAQLLRINRPIGTLLLLWPTYWALWLAGDGSPSIGNVIVFTLGVFFMRAAGCAINDFADRDWDKHVKCTKDRPLTTGRVKAWEAVALFGGLCILSFLMVVFFTNTFTLYLSFGGALLAFIYPFSKRFTHLPQLFLGAAFSWAIPMAWAAEAGELSQVTWLLFTANVLWTVAYDTFYAMVDRDDDVKVGIKSTAILFGDADRAIIGVLQAMVVLILMIVGSRYELGTFYHLGLVAMACLFIYQQYLAKDRERDGCFKAFLNNNWAGFAVFAGLVIDLLIT